MRGAREAGYSLSGMRLPPNDGTLSLFNLTPDSRRSPKTARGRYREYSRQGQQPAKISQSATLSLCPRPDTREPDRLQARTGLPAAL
jgi:hypothetical protein